MGREKGQLVGPTQKRRDDPYAEALERARCAKNLTMAQLAELSGVSLRTIKGLCVGELKQRGPHGRTRGKLYGVLGVNLAESARQIEAEWKRERRKGRRR